MMVFTLRRLSSILSRGCFYTRLQLLHVEFIVMNSMFQRVGKLNKITCCGLD